jgi:pimeloyl-ACP methyl ester carboxylesterase
MPKGYVEELVETKASDGVELAGAVIRPAAAARSLPIVWIHGFTGRYYEPVAIRIGRRLAERGHVFVTGNNRGNNYGAILHDREKGEQRLGGAAWENLEESQLDVDAWISFAAGLGYEQVALVGHSLGGMKSTYYVATRNDPRVRTLVNASGPVWRFVGPAPDQTARLAEAERMVAEGRGLDLMPPAFDNGRHSVSAQRVVNARRFHDVLFGRGGKPPATALVRCPLFAFIGSEETWLGEPKDLDWLREASTASPRVETRVFHGADHVYTGHEVEVADAIADWVESLE